MDQSVKLRVCNGCTEQVVNAETFGMVQAVVDEPEVVVCFGEHKHPGATRFTSAAVDATSLATFVSVFGGATPTAECRANFCTLKTCCDFFCVTIAGMQQFYDFVARAAPLVTDPVTGFTAFVVCGDVSARLPGLHIADDTRAPLVNPEAVMSLATFSKLNRLRFMCAHGQDDKTLSTQLAPQDAARRMGVPEPVVEKLDPTSCVVAGGAIAYLNCKIEWQQFSDVDIFVLDNDQRPAVVAQLVQGLSQADLVVCRAGPSVLTAVGVYDRRRIQIIATTATNPFDLIKNFDLNLCKGFYDGQVMRYTYRAALDWITGKCSNGERDISPKRLAKAELKGFALTPEAKTYLKNTVGYPVPPGLVARLKYMFPFLTPGVPFHAQDQALRKFGLVPLTVASAETKTCSADVVNPADASLVPMGNSYGPMGVFRGTNLEDFVGTVELDTKNPPCKYHAYTMTFLKSDYLLELPPCTPAFTCVPPAKELGIVGIMKLTKLKISDSADVARFAALYDAILGKFTETKVEKFESKEYPDVPVRLAYDTKWFVNGLRVDEPVRINYTQTVKAVVAVQKVLSRTEPQIPEPKLVFEIRKMMVKDPNSNIW